MFFCEICKNFRNIFFQDTLDDCFWIFQLTSSYLEAYPKSSLCLLISLPCLLQMSFWIYQTPLDSYKWKQFHSSRFTSVLLNPFHATDLFWYPLKTSETQRFSDVFRGYQKSSVTWNGVNCISIVLGILKILLRGLISLNYAAVIYKIQYCNVTDE